MISRESDKLLADFDRFYILTLLYEGPTHGYGILQKFQERIKKKGSPGLVYPFLQHLEDRGLVTHTTEMHGDRERKTYSLSIDGRKFCEQLFKRFSSIVSTAIEPSLKQCAHCGCTLYDGGHRETIAGEKIMFCCSHCANSYKSENGLSKDVFATMESMTHVE
jgi:DNA-binding PadR family transcriptional regulator